MVIWGIAWNSWNGTGRRWVMAGKWFRGWASPLPTSPNLLRGTPGRGFAAGVDSTVTPVVGGSWGKDPLRSGGIVAGPTGYGKPTPSGDNPRMSITIKTPADIEKMRVAGRLAAEVLQVVAPHVKPGVTTAELDRICHDHIVNVQQAIPANVGYRGFPATVCTSVNNVICHGIPSEAKVLRDGDIVNIDVTVIKDGWHGDTSRMYYAGTPTVMARRLVDVTREAMFRGIRAVRPGATLGNVGHAIQQYAEGERFS